MNATYHLSLKDLNGEFIQDLQERFGNAPIELTVGAAATNYLLTEDQFWEFISLLDWEQLPDEHAVVEPLVQKLAESPVRCIYDFYDILSEKLFALDGEAFASQIGEAAYREGKHFSADHFLDVRSCVVANGKEFFEEVLQYPEKMPKDLFFETLPYVAYMAYQRKSGKAFDYPSRHKYLTFSNKEGWASQYP